MQVYGIKSETREKVVISLTAELCLFFLLLEVSVLFAMTLKCEPPIYFLVPLLVLSTVYSD